MYKYKTDHQTVQFIILFAHFRLGIFSPMLKNLAVDNYRTVRTDSARFTILAIKMWILFPS